LKISIVSNDESQANLSHRWKVKAGLTVFIMKEIAPSGVAP
jgi:hypothetical protein